MTITEKEWFIEAPWGRICIIAWGDCRHPPVLVCHGISDSVATFRHLIKLLPENFYYIGMDLPGCGKSDPFPPGLLFNCYDLMYAMEVVVRHFRWSSFIFMGHSMGASIGKLYEFCCPGKISKSIELDPVTDVVDPEDFSEWYKNTYQQYFDDYESYNSPKEDWPVLTKEEAIDKMVKARRFTKELAEETVERLTEPVGDGLVRFNFDKRYRVVVKPPFSAAMLQRLVFSLKTPVLVIPMEETVKLGVYSNRKISFMLNEGLYPNGNCRSRVVAGHHNSHVTHPERLAPYLCQFLLHDLQGLDRKAKL